MRGSLDECQCRLSVCLDRNEFFADEHLAKIAKSMDEKSASWESKLELEEILPKKIRQFPEKSDRKSVWNGQRT